MTKLTLGPIAYHWSADKRRDFYACIADEAPVDEVYLGEVNCSKRAPFHEADLPATIERLERAGKTVIVSTLAERDAEPRAQGNRGHRRDGHARNRGEQRCGALRARQARDLGLGLEVQVLGRASLAVSARCYHARAHCRTKDNCQFICEDDPDGIQTQSESYIDLLPEARRLVADGVTHLRLMPQDVDMVAVADVFRTVLEDRQDVAEADARLAVIAGGTGMSNGFNHGSAGYRRIAAAAAG